MKNKIIVLTIVVFGAVFSTINAASGEDLTKEAPWESFETGSSDWGVPFWDNPAVAVSVSTENVSEGDYSLRCDFDTRHKKGNAVFMLEKEIDLSNALELKLDVYNPSPSEIKAALLVSSGKDWDQQQTDWKKLVPGWNKDVAYALGADKFSPLIIDKTTNKLLPKMSNLHALGIILEVPAMEGSLYIDNIRVVYGETTTGFQKSEELKISGITENSKIIGLYKKFELTLGIRATYDNPYDPEDIDLTAEFTSPSGRRSVIPGFFYQDFKRVIDKNQEFLVPADSPVWKIRFTPTEAGKWKYKIKIKDRTGEIASQEAIFECQPSKEHGFVRVSTGDPLYFEFDDKAPYFAIGMNVCWYDGKRGTLDYENWYKKMSENGMNFSRLWMSASWGFGIEGKDTGLGNYTNRLDRAWQLDYVIDLSEKSGIYNMLCLLNHGLFSTTANSEWVNNPYYESNGGPCAKPSDFLSNAEAKKYFKRWLRYVVARWSYSPYILSWEWWNEVDHANFDLNELAPWIREMSEYLDTLDPYKHPRTISFANKSGDKIFSMPEISFTQKHRYATGYWASVVSYDSRKMTKKYNKPFIMGEFGQSWRNGQECISADPGGIHLHNAIWSAALSGSAGTAMIWWWDSYVDPQNLYYHYKALSRFAKDERWTSSGFRKLDSSLNTDKLEAYGLQNDERALVWIKDKNYEITNDPKPGKTFFPPIIREKITINGLKKGEYAVEWWDTYKGSTITQKSLRYEEKEGLTIEIPVFSKDIACKILKKQ